MSYFSPHRPVLPNSADFGDPRVPGADRDGRIVDGRPRLFSRKISVAPMMDWTDRHCRYFHRLLAPHALLYTEMIVAKAILRGDRARLLDFDPAEGPVALQLGGCDPGELAEAAAFGAAAGYVEINLNVGCPSDRVKTGSFGACLMADPKLVAACVAGMRAAVSIPVTVKCRIGIDDRDSYEFFDAFAAAQLDAGIDALIVHARAAILSGLSPKENREIPPLRYDYVYRLKRGRPAATIVLNGGVADALAVRTHFAEGVDGVMLGRAAYHRPALLSELEREFSDPDWIAPRPEAVLERIQEYARRESAKGTRLHSITRHLHGLLAGADGARAWRRFLSEIAAMPDAEAGILSAALPLVTGRSAQERQVKYN
ncbi:MAG: tRNA dihydrouridine(20/20a) synthase DusA [Gammaproteobacteria bacterium]|nr:tRNA dihydrouridine(20/20a) synthase DusA [Gammaproteobacteria bacterium]